ncbi:MAG: hypothetical protein CSYNP_01023 [Syntrophus sp. SKADARSKE-3]|nr:hypothetical protein [Syntrophus sp. SKADARSKE-3]
MSSFTLDKNKILDASRIVFARHGFRKASLADIVRPLGVAKTALYHYFPGGKRELIKAVIQREADMILCEMRCAIDKEQDPRYRLRALIVSKLTYFHQLRELFEISQDVGDEIAQLYYTNEKAYHEAEQDLILEILMNGCEAGYFSIADPRATALSIRVLLHHFERSFVFEKNRDEMEKTVDDLLNILFYGIINHQTLSLKRGNF